MNKNELMVCDWVRYNPNVFIEDEYEPAKDWENVMIERGDDIDLAVENCYEPISLTQDILKGNGFVESTSINGWSCLTYSPCTSWQPCMPRIDLVKFDDKWHVRTQDCMPFNVNGLIQYTHELQHALRLCGLNELADNFKLSTTKCNETTNEK